MANLNNKQNSYPATVTGDARTEIKTKSNGSQYVSVIVEVEIGGALYKVWANRTLINAEGVEKTDVEPGDKVTVFHHTFVGKDDKTMHSFDISKGTQTLSNEDLNALMGL